MGLTRLLALALAAGCSAFVPSTHRRYAHVLSKARDVAIKAGDVDAEIMGETPPHPTRPEPHGSHTRPSLLIRTLVVWDVRVYHEGTRARKHAHAQTHVHPRTHTHTHTHMRR